jgi:signal transduction histidine kinase
MIASDANDVQILMVDDRPENLLALEAILQPLGHTLVRASSGREALKALLERDFAVILLDVQMPGIDGYETAELIRGRERSQSTPILFLTAINTGAHQVFRGYEVGAVDYLLKPIEPSILISKVSVFVDLYRRNRKVSQQARLLEDRVRERTAELAEALTREQEARKEAEAAVRARDHFLAVASHELKTPLTAIFGNLQLLQRRLAADPACEERNRRSIEVAVEQTARLNHLIEMLLDISRIQTGMLSIARAPVELGALLRRVAREVEPTLERHELSLIVADEPLSLEGDELRLEQVLHNLIGNAVKYSPNGGKVTVRAGRRNGSVAVAVSDEGIGIPAEELPYIFDHFYRAENTDDRQIDGMGIGLYVVRQVVALHGGEVGVSSSEGVGSTFTITLPALPPAAPRAAPEATAAAP